MMPTMRGSLIIVVLAAAVLSGCAPRAETGSFDSPDPQSKLYAIVRAGDQKDRTAIPHLITALGSDDQAVRMYAIEALYRITGEKKGYVFYDIPAKREVAIQRWLDAYQAGEFGPVSGLSKKTVATGDSLQGSGAGAK
jgi:hypothetical protein